jgi:hypothetical protein
MKLLEQVVGGFVAPGGEDNFTTEIDKPDFENFIMCSKELLDSGVSVGKLVDELVKLPKVEPKGREENNDYEYPQDALQTLPSFPG